MTTHGVLGTVTGLWRYPIKSLAAQPLHSAYADERGIEGDRRAALFVATPGAPREGKPLRGKEQPRFHTVDTTQDARRLAEPLDLRFHDEGPYFDARPVSLIFDTWLAELQQLAGHDVEPLRFRPNLYARAATKIPPESDFVGARLRAGSVVLRVLEPIVRCVTPSYDLSTGASSTSLLRALVHLRGNLMGVYCSVERAGTVAIADDVQILDVETPRASEDT